MATVKISVKITDLVKQLLRPLVLTVFVGSLKTIFSFSSFNNGSIISHPYIKIIP